jgi:uncharacterized protein (DUF1697 family)
MLDDKGIKQVIDFVKKEPRTVQDVSKLIGRSWVTTDSYLNKIKDSTGLIAIKTFRKGSQGALKIVYHTSTESSKCDELKTILSNQIMHGRFKGDFDFMEVFQFIDNKKKMAFIDEQKEGVISGKEDIIGLFKQATNKVYIFSGNVSFLSSKQGKIKIINSLEDMLKRGILVKILCRVNLASIFNLNNLNRLILKYPGLLEIKHSYQPLRGMIIDDKIARFRDEEQVKFYKKGELDKNQIIFYEIHDEEWILWLQNVFWSKFRNSISSESRMKDIDKVF